MPPSNERQWPQDLLGNDLRKGQIVHIKLPEAGLICRVVDVIQAGTMHDPDNKPIRLQGSVAFTFQIPYDQGQSFAQVLALKEPAK
jgi:hypothetical protein